MRIALFAFGIASAISASVALGQDDSDDSFDPVKAHQFITAVLTRGTAKVQLSAVVLKVDSVASSGCATAIVIHTRAGNNVNIGIDWGKITSTNGFQGDVDLDGPVQVSGGDTGRSLVSPSVRLIVESDLTDRLTTAMDGLIERCDTLKQLGY